MAGPIQGGDPMRRSRFSQWVKCSLILLWGGLSASGVWAQTATPTSTSTPSEICCSPFPGWIPSSQGQAAGVAVDTFRHRVYASDSFKGRVRAYHYDGSPEGAFGGGSVSLGGAFAVAVGKCGDGVYVMQRGLNPTNVYKLNSDGDILWKSDNLPSGGLRSLSVDDLGNIYVTADNYPIILLDPDGKLKPDLYGTGPLGPLGANPTGSLKVGLNLFVVDSDNNRILKFVESGVNTYSYILSQAVTMPTTYPCGIAGDLNGKYYVTFYNDNGYAVFDSNFNQLTQICGSSAMVAAFGIALDETGAVYVAAAGPSKVVKMDPCFSQPVSPPCGPAYHGVDPPSPGSCFVYPSPARGNEANVSYKMEESGRVEIKVWNDKTGLVGHFTKNLPAGVQDTPFNISQYPSGVYFYVVKLSYDSGRVEQLKPGKFVVLH